jgi:acetate kinase
MREYNFTTDQLNDLLNKESGLKGVSGISGDLRAIFDSIDKGNQRAQLAFDIYIHRLQSLIGSMLTSLGGLDALIFTAGVGENAPLVREKVSAGLSFLGVELDQAKNNAHPVDQDIATATSSVRILVIHTEEDWAIAKEAWNIYDQFQLTSAHF